jgi:hypothetical protein
MFFVYSENANTILEFSISIRNIICLFFQYHINTQNFKKLQIRKNPNGRKIFGRKKKTCPEKKNNVW